MKILSRISKEGINNEEEDPEIFQLNGIFCLFALTFFKTRR